jgi:hypothetical protein
MVQGANLSVLAHHWSLTWARWIQSTTSWLERSFYYLSYFLCATCPTNLIFFYMYYISVCTREMFEAREWENVNPKGKHNRSVMVAMQGPDTARPSCIPTYTGKYEKQWRMWHTSAWRKVKNKIPLFSFLCSEAYSFQVADTERH